MAIRLAEKPVETARKLFGTDGIRGTANVYPMTGELMLQLGRAVAYLIKRGNHRHRVVIGKDTRLSGYMLETALASGVCSMGVDVLLCGPLPTPAISNLTVSMRADAGAVISASHNPYGDNGIKFFSADGFKLPDEVEAEIEDLIANDKLHHLRPTATSIGKAYRIDDAAGRYIVYAKNTFPRHLTLEGLTIVIDCAHGAAYRVAPAVLEELGARVIVIGNQPDGKNINRGFGALHPETMCKTVKKTGANLGIALDGDADRVVLVDEKGRLIDGDQLLAVVAESFKEDGRLARPGIVGTVMSNLGLERHLAGLGIELARTPVGDRYVLERMRADGYNVGGEQSGHIILSDYTTTGDGFVAALQVLSVVQKSGKPVSQLCHRFEPLPQVLKNVRYEGARPLEESAVKAAIASAQRRLDGQGRLLVRSSGTEPVIRVMGEGEDRALVEAVVDDVVDALAKSAAA
jgi:phosphoglucosamine mutase